MGVNRASAELPKIWTSVPMCLAWISSIRLERRKMSELQLSGGCDCGEVRFACTANPINAYKCHCRTCQRLSGSGFMAVIWVLRNKWALTQGEPTVYVTEADSGRSLHRNFCKTCGSNLFVHHSAMPDTVMIVPSALDDPSVFKPRAVLWTSSAYAWDHIDQSIPNFAAQPSIKEIMALASF